MNQKHKKESSCEKLAEVQGFGLDEIGLSKQPKLLSQLQENEHIILSSWVEKFNENNKCQPRIFLLTDQAIYNVIRSENFIKSIMSKWVPFQNKFIIRRKINFLQIQAVTLSNLQGNKQFVLHVRNEYDYRFQVADHNKKISLLKSICIQYEKCLKRKMSFYFVNDIMLVKYCTFKADLKNKKNKKPNKEPVYLNVEDLIDYESPGAKFNLVYSANKENVSIEKFKSSSLEMIKDSRRYFSLQMLQNKFDGFKCCLENSHPFILLPSFCFETEEHSYLLRPLMTGGIMDKILMQNGTFTKKLVVFYVAQIILALQYLHSKGWIYRTLSLNRIYLKENGYIALEGLNKNLIRMQQIKMYDLCGIEENFPPQMILCEGYDYKIDVWCLGILTYQLLEGHHPFIGKNRKTTFSNILKEQIQDTDALPEYVYGALRKDPQKRITLEEVKKDPWFFDLNWEKLSSQKLQPPYLAEESSIKSWQGKLPTIVYLEN